MGRTIVIVPASFTPAETYADFENALQHAGFKAITVSLPSVGLHTSGKKAATMGEDAAEIIRVVEQIYDGSDSEEVVLLAHSYGGIPASESMKSVSSKNRKALGKTGVSKIIYVAAIVLPVGVSNDEMRKRPPPPHVRIENDWIITDHVKDAHYDFNDLPVDQARAWAARMQDQSAASFRERATYAGYADVEIHYVRCTEDMCLPAEGTQRILAVMREASSAVEGGSAPVVHEFGSGHCPMMSKPQELAQFVSKILD